MAISNKAKSVKNKCKYADGIKKIDDTSIQYPPAIRLSRLLTLIEKNILLFIFSASKGKSILVPNKLIAHFCDCAETTVSIALSKFVKMGYLTRIFSSGARYLSVTEENLENIWTREREGIIKHMNEYIVLHPEAYEDFIIKKTSNNKKR